jgi:hypothetical protein
MNFNKVKVRSLVDQWYLNTRACSQGIIFHKYSFKLKEGVMRKFCAFIAVLCVITLIVPVSVFAQAEGAGAGAAAAGTAAGTTAVSGVVAGTVAVGVVAAAAVAVAVAASSGTSTTARH